MKTMDTKRIQRNRKINAAVWAVLAITLMICAYAKWSEYGEYTAISFFASLAFHAGPCALFGACIDERLRNKLGK